MLIQSEADALIATKKKRTTTEPYDFPSAGKSLAIPVVSIDEKESFLVDIAKGKIRLSKCTYQERYAKTNILVRLDVDGPPHTNPRADSVPIRCFDQYNGTIVESPHLHLYVEGYETKWAIPAPTDRFQKTMDLYETLHDFFSYCNVVKPPLVQKVLL